jgi:hypothetical protein
MDEETQENEPSNLDEMTHTELRMMHEEATNAILFSKSVQWRVVGVSLLIFGGIVIVTSASIVTRSSSSLLTLLAISLSCGAIFLLMMYQFWQYNEIKRIIAIEKLFSSQYNKIRNLNSRREGNIDRYTLLIFMTMVIIAGASFAISGIRLIK